MKLQLATNYEDFCWAFAEYEPGKRVTKDMVTFDTEREDVRVNLHGVILFYDFQTARMLLNKDFPNEAIQ